MFEGKINLKKSYIVNHKKLDRLADRRRSNYIFASWQWQYRFDGASIVFVIECDRSIIGRFGVRCCWYIDTLKFRYNGAPCRSDFVRWLYTLGLSPIDCAIVADSVDFD